MKSLILLLLASVGFYLVADEKDGTDRRAERIRQLDKDGDGKISKDEMPKQLWERISRYDSDGDEKLSAEELKAAGLDAEQGKAGKRPGGAPASFKVETFTGSNDQKLNYSLYVPPTREEKGKLPVVLCLHGRGGNTEAPLVLSQPDMLAKYPCIIIAPGIDGAKERWAGNLGERDRHRSVDVELMELLDEVIRKHGGDAQRVYVTGQSMGGVGTWGLMATNPNRIAAAVPVCGIWKPEDAEKMKAIPVWAFHGADDATVPVSGSRDMVAALKKAGAEPKYTEFPGVGHGSWSKTYATAEMWEWMFAQKRKE